MEEEMTREAIAGELFRAAERYARRRKVEFGPGAKQDIQRFSEKAAAEIERTSEKEQGGRIKAASLSFELLIDEMIRQSRKIPNYQAQNIGVIGEQTLGNALSVLCPLWPFC